MTGPDYHKYPTTLGNCYTPPLVVLVAPPSPDMIYIPSQALSSSANKLSNTLYDGPDYHEYPTPLRGLIITWMSFCLPRYYILFGVW